MSTEQIIRAEEEIIRAEAVLQEGLKQFEADFPPRPPPRSLRSRTNSIGKYIIEFNEDSMKTLSEPLNPKDPEIVFKFADPLGRRPNILDFYEIHRTPIGSLKWHPDINDSSQLGQFRETIQSWPYATLTHHAFACLLFDLILSYKKPEHETIIFIILPLHSQVKWDGPLCLFHHYAIMVNDIL